MSDLKAAIKERLWRAVDRSSDILSATLTGSFVESAGLEGVSDIDFVVVVEHLDRLVFDRVVRTFEGELEPALAGLGWSLRINPTLGPLKFNDEHTAVLHLMLYSRQRHIDHAVLSPFTVFDWQRSREYRGASMAEVYPVFGLQPRHFFGARRGARDYMRDLLDGQISYRELVCDDTGYAEEKRGKPMTERDRVEFAFHIMRFLMQNLVKLVDRTNAVLPDARLVERYVEVFPDGAGEIRPLWRALAAAKRSRSFTDSPPNLIGHVTRFTERFEGQFRDEFETRAGVHLAFRHAPTDLNAGPGGEVRFLGRSDPPIRPASESDVERVAAAVRALSPEHVFTSPALRCGQSLAAVAAHAALPDAVADARLLEFDYGACEGCTATEARAAHPGLFEAWGRGGDPPFPGGGESSEAVLRRASAFAESCWTPGSRSLTCTHNGVVRLLIARWLGVPAAEAYRLRVPYLTPIRFVCTPRFGLFVDLEPETERQLFQSWSEAGRSAAPEPVGGSARPAHGIEER